MGTIGATGLAVVVVVLHTNGPSQHALLPRAFSISAPSSKVLSPSTNCPRRARRCPLSTIMARASATRLDKGTARVTGSPERVT